MKTSSATFERATGRPQRTGRSSGRRPSPTSAEVIALTGPSEPPDPERHAYRKDLADVALAGRVIASHYAEPLRRVVVSRTTLKTEPNEESVSVREVDAGEPFDMLDNSVGWAWGYAGTERRVGYVRAEALGRPD